MSNNSWIIIYEKQCVKDECNLKSAHLTAKKEHLIDTLRSNPFVNPPPYEKLSGHANRYARRIDIRHRLVYEVYKKEHIVKILRMWTHYEDN